MQMHGWFRFQHRSLVWAWFVSLFIYEYSTDNSSEQHQTRLLANTVLDVLCWAEDRCMPEIREQGDSCPEEEERDISFSYSVPNACRINAKPHPVDLSHAYFIKHPDTAESLIGGKVGLFWRCSVCSGTRGQRSEHQQLCTFLTEDGC